MTDSFIVPTRFVYNSGKFGRLLDWLLLNIFLCTVQEPLCLCSVNVEYFMLISASFSVCTQWDTEMSATYAPLSYDCPTVGYFEQIIFAVTVITHYKWL